MRTWLYQQNYLAFRIVRVILDICISELSIFVYLYVYFLYVAGSVSGILQETEMVQRIEVRAT